jgi:hypothetical protein
MKVKELIEELKKFNADAELRITSCQNNDNKCPVVEGGECNSFNCHYSSYDIMFVEKCEKCADAPYDKFDFPEIAIDKTDDWYYDEKGELIIDN